MKSKVLAHIFRWIFIPLAAVFLVFLIEYTGFFEGMNNYFYDLFFRVRGEREPAPSIIIAAIDENTLQDLGRWPIDRRHYAQVLERMNQARVVAFDIILAEPGKDDSTLARAVKEHGRVILPVYFDKHLTPFGPVNQLKPLRIGHVHVEQGIDGVVRKVFHTIYHRDEAFPSFSSVIYETIRGISLERKNISPQSTLKVSPDYLKQNDMMRINYFGGPGIFPTISLTQIIQGLYSPDFFKDKIILVGLTAEGLEDSVLSPFSQLRRRMPGVEVHAHSVNNLLNCNAIKDIPLWIQWLSSIIVSIICSLLFFTIGENRSAGAWILIIFFITAVSFTLFSYFNLWLNPVEYYCLTTVLAAAAYIVRLNDAARGLEREYSDIVSHMRWKTKKSDEKISDKGIYGFLTRGGINEKIRILSQITDQFFFEKSLTDTALYSDIHGVMLYNDQKDLIIANNRAQSLFMTSDVELSDLTAFTRGISSLIMEKDDIEESLRTMEDKGLQGLTFTLSLTTPQKMFLKLDITSLIFMNHRYLLFVLTDITQIKELEILKGQMVSIVSHELKTPISSIQGFSELLIDSVEGDLKIFSQIINDEAQRLSRLINTFLDISRIESGGQKITMAPGNLIELINETIPLIEPAAGPKNITVKADTPNFITPVMYDSDLMRQCVVNLIENAIKYSPPCTDVTVKLTEHKKFIQVDIVDMGYGINKEEKDKIFDKFYRASSPNALQEKGSGLGLAFVKEAVEAQQGHIEVSTAQDKGSTFSLTFPKVH